MTENTQHSFWRGQNLLGVMLMDVTGMLLTSQEDFPSSQEESDAPVISTVDPEHISEDSEASEMDVDSHIHQKEENHEEPPRDTDEDIPVSSLNTLQTQDDVGVIERRGSWNLSADLSHTDKDNPKSEQPKPKPKPKPKPNSASYKGSSESNPFSKIASQTTKPSVRSNPSAKNTSSKQTTTNTNTSSPARKVATAKRDLSGNLDVRLYINLSTGKRKIPDTTPEKHTQVKKTSS